MHYLGGKKRIAGTITSYLNQFSEHLDYYEPFCGSMSIVPKLKDFNSFNCSDIHEDLILMFQALKSGWTPPDFISEEEYLKIKSEPPSALRGFVGFGCSFSGKWWGGYCRDGTNRNYTKNAKNSLLKHLSYYQKCEFNHQSYQQLKPKNALIYCDPPYKNTTKYSYLKETFNHEEFWNVMRYWSKDNIVLISEYAAPEDFKCVLDIPTKTDLRNKDNKQEIRLEKLFQYDNSST